MNAAQWLNSLEGSEWSQRKHRIPGERGPVVSGRGGDLPYSGGVFGEVKDDEYDAHCAQFS